MLIGPHCTNILVKILVDTAHITVVQVEGPSGGITILQWRPVIISYKRGSWSVTIVSKGLLNIMKNFPNTKFDIHGHTDNTGDDAMNLDLSKRRAASVKKYFMDKSIDGSRLFPEGYGETKPITTNDTPEGRQQNRRVEIKLR